MVERTGDFPVAPQHPSESPLATVGVMVAGGSGADGGFSGEGLGLGLVTAAFQEQLPILLPKEWFKMSPIQRILWMITRLPHFLKSLQSCWLVTPSLGSPRFL